MQSNQLELRDREHAVHQANILSIALLLGPSIFLAIACWLVFSGSMPKADLMGVLMGMGLIGAVGCLIGSMIAPQLVGLPEERSEQLLMQTWLGRNLIQKALLEGALFLNIIGFLLEQHFVSLVIVAFLMAAMLATFPTRTKLDHFIESNSET